MKLVSKLSIVAVVMLITACAQEIQRITILFRMR